MQKACRTLGGLRDSQEKVTELGKSCHENGISSPCFMPHCPFLPDESHKAYYLKKRRGLSRLRGDGCGDSLKCWIQRRELEVVACAYNPGTWEAAHLYSKEEGRREERKGVLEGRRGRKVGGRDGERQEEGKEERKGEKEEGREGRGER